MVSIPDAVPGQPFRCEPARPTKVVEQENGRRASVAEANHAVEMNPGTLEGSRLLYLSGLSATGHSILLVQEPTNLWLRSTSPLHVIDFRYARLVRVTDSMWI